MKKLVSLTQQISDCVILLQNDKYRNLAISHLSKISPEVEEGVSKLHEVKETEVVVTTKNYYATNT